MVRRSQVRDGRLESAGNTIPGVDHTSACAILAEIGPDLRAFGDARRLAAWAGLCPGNNESAGQTPFRNDDGTVSVCWPSPHAPQEQRTVPVH